MYPKMIPREITTPTDLTIAMSKNLIKSLQLHLCPCSKYHLRHACLFELC
jgi:hypothetical protein